MSRTPVSLGGNGYGQLNGTAIQDCRGFVIAVAIGDIPELDSQRTASSIIAALNDRADLMAELADLRAEHQELLSECAQLTVLAQS